MFCTTHNVFLDSTEYSFQTSLLMRLSLWGDISSTCTLGNVHIMQLLITLIIIIKGLLLLLLLLFNIHTNNIINIFERRRALVSRSQTSRLPLVLCPPMRTAFGTEWGQSAWTTGNALENICTGKPTKNNIIHPSRMTV